MGVNPMITEKDRSQEGVLESNKNYVGMYYDLLGVLDTLIGSGDDGRKRAEIEGKLAFYSDYRSKANVLISTINGHSAVLMGEIKKLKRELKACRKRAEELRQLDLPFHGRD